jgi:hypothetical protein
MMQYKEITGERTMKIRIALALFATVAWTAFGCAGNTSSPDSPDGPDAIPASAEQTSPLGAGAAVPSVMLETADKEPFDLKLAVEKQPTVLIFYRGGW